MIPAVFGRRRLTVRRFDAHRDGWVDAPPGDVSSDARVDVTELTVSTFNVWNKAFFAEQRYQALADLLQLLKRIEAEVDSERSTRELPES